MLSIKDLQLLFCARIGLTESVVLVTAWQGGDADESATYVDLQVSVSTGMVHCDAFAGRRAGIFTTRCAGTSSDPSFPSLASCEVGAEVALRPTRGRLHEKNSVCKLYERVFGSL